MLRIAALASLAAGLAVSAVHAQAVRHVLDFPKEYTSSVGIDDAGTAVYAVSSTNQFGTNPGYLKQIVRWDPATGIGTQITDFEEGVDSVSVSDDGSWLAFVSGADLLGTNHDESPELYVMHPDGTGLAQLTSLSLAPLEAPRGVLAAVISGSGNRIAFVGRIDPLGTNPTYTIALFVIDRDGTNLRQLRTDVELGGADLFAPEPSSGIDSRRFDISDDGSKVVYTMRSPRQFAGINADGTGDHIFSGTTTPGGIAISGDGTKIVYTVGVSKTVHVRSFDGNSGTVVTLGLGQQPSITDDATLVFFYRLATPPSAPAGIWRMASTGGPATLIAQDLRTVCVSGSGSRILARNTELVAIDGTGANLQQLTTTTVDESGFAFSMSSDGSTVHFGSTIDPLGTNPAHDFEYFSYNLDTGQFWQRTNASTPILYETRMSDDGSVFFISASDPTGQNPCGDTQLFRLSPGGASTQLTVCGELEVHSEYLEVRPDGQVAVFAAIVGGDYEAIAVNGDGTGRTQLSPSEPRASVDFGASVAGIGPVTWVAFISEGDLFRVKADGTGLQQLTSDPWGGYEPSISADGSVVAWSSGHDFGQNPDNSPESFVFDDATQTIRQITNDQGGFAPIVTQDGQWVFVGEGRYNVASAVYEPAAGPHAPLFSIWELLPDATGSRWLIPEGASNKKSKTSLFLADLNAVPAFVVEKASPTVLSWDASPFSLRYDVVRGSVSNLSIAGSTVSLGAVSCLEDDSPDNHTRGYGDPVEPASGEAFFYLYSGSVGFNAAAGSYGQGTGGKERVAGAGGCNP